MPHEHALAVDAGLHMHALSLCSTGRPSNNGRWRAMANANLQC